MVILHVHTFNTTTAASHFSPAQNPPIWPIILSELVSGKEKRKRHINFRSKIHSRHLFDFHEFYLNQVVEYFCV